MTLSLKERRALLSLAEKASDQNDFSSFATALDGAGEEDRVALGKTLPPARWFNAEGATPRAIYVLVALGKPKSVAEALARSKSTYLDSIHRAATGRTTPWILELCDQLVEASRFDNSAIDIALKLQAELGLIADYPTNLSGLPPYVGRKVKRDEGKESDPLAGGQYIVEQLSRYDGLLMHSFWRFFQVDGMGSHWHMTRWAPLSWDAAVRTLCDSTPLFRERILDESLGALLRDFSTANVVWYLHLQRLLDPDEAEIAARQSLWLAVLETAPSTAVSLAQDMLARIIHSDALDAATLVEASRGVLARSEKKLVKAQLKMLAKLKESGQQSERISRVVAAVIDGMPIDLAAIANKLVETVGGNGSEDCGADRPVPTVSVPVPVPVSVPGPRRFPLPPVVVDREPIRNDEALFFLISHILEDVGDGADFPRIFDYVLAHPDVAFPETLKKRSAEVVEPIGEYLRVSSARCLMVAALWGGEPIPFSGYEETFRLAEGEPMPPGCEIIEHKTSVDSGNSVTGRAGDGYVSPQREVRRYIGTHSPKALLIGEFQRLQRWRNEQVAFSPVGIVAEHRFVWSKVQTVPGKNRRNPFWTVAGAQAVHEESARFDDLALDVGNVPLESDFRASDAHVTHDGNELLVQWFAWILRENLDSLAAHFHPLLSSAVDWKIARGFAPLLSALGASRKPPGAPLYSALALAASACSSEPRAQTAEAIARLADSGLLDAQGLGQQLAEHLAEGYVMAGRVAQTLADTASISALAGYRALQTVEIMLPQVLDAEGKPRSQAGKLVELAARLSIDYGCPVSIPESLASRNKGSSALAVSLRALEGVVAQPTALLQEAAAAAQRMQEHEVTT